MLGICGVPIIVRVRMRSPSLFALFAAQPPSCCPHDAAPPSSSRLLPAPPSSSPYALCVLHRAPPSLVPLRLEHLCGSIPHAQVDEALLSNAYAWMRKAADDSLDGMARIPPYRDSLSSPVEASRYDISRRLNRGVVSSGAAAAGWGSHRWVKRPEACTRCACVRC